MADVKKIATRESYGNTLKELAAEGHDELVVLDADLAAATKTGMFRKAYPDRHFDCGIAEGNMMGVAAGLSTMGYVPFVSSFAMFAAGRAFEQVRNSIGYPHLNVKIGATHGGISVGEDGASHQCCEDFALMRSIPGMTVICPADDVEARAAVRAAYAMEGPVYLRFGRLAVPVFHDAENYHFEIGKGEQIRLVLTSLFAGGHVLIDDIPGVGKTTLVNLLMRFYDIQSGKITIDGHDIVAVSREDVRGLFGMVLQDTWLFGGTVADNVAYGKPKATREEIVTACDEAYCDHFIRTLPQGYDTVVSEDSINISGGQKQLLTIARALLANRRLLILDEATSNVDTRTEILLQKAMDKLMRGRTCFVIAHRLSTIVDADLILVINDGQIVETGTHEGLLEKQGFYYRLYTSQYAV